VSDRQPTPAQRYRDAVWEATADQLTSTEKLVALAYADHCRNGGDTAWVTYRRLMQRCAIRSMSTVTRVLAALADKGWLQLVGPSPRHKQSPVYRLTIPDGTAPMVGADQEESTDVHEAAPMVDGTAPMVEANRTDDRCKPHRPSVTTLQTVTLEDCLEGDAAAANGAAAPPSTGLSPAAQAAIAYMRRRLAAAKPATQPRRLR